MTLTNTIEGTVEGGGRGVVVHGEKSGGAAEGGGVDRAWIGGTSGTL